MEDDLAKKYENRHAKELVEVLRRLDLRLPSAFRRDGFPLKQIVAEMVALQMVRTPRFRENLRGSAKREAALPSTTLSEEQFMKVAHLLSLADTQSLSDLTRHVANMGMIFLAFSGLVPLMTSDTPIITGNTNPETGKMRLLSSMGVGREGAEVYLPLSPRYMLVCFGPHVDQPDLQLLPRRDGLAYELNAITIANAQRYVFSRRRFQSAAYA